MILNSLGSIAVGASASLAPAQTFNVKQKTEYSGDFTTSKLDAAIGSNDMVDFHSSWGVANSGSQTTHFDRVFSYSDLKNSMNHITNKDSNTVAKFSKIYLKPSFKTTNHPGSVDESELSTLSLIINFKDGKSETLLNQNFHKRTYSFNSGNHPDWVIFYLDSKEFKLEEIDSINVSGAIHWKVEEAAGSPFGDQTTVKLDSVSTRIQGSLYQKIQDKKIDSLANADDKAFDPEETNIFNTNLTIDDLKNAKDLIMTYSQGNVRSKAIILKKVADLKHSIIYNADKIDFEISFDKDEENFIVKNQGTEKTTIHSFATL